MKTSEMETVYDLGSKMIEAVQKEKVRLGGWAGAGSAAGDGGWWGGVGSAGQPGWRSALSGAPSPPPCI